MTRYSLQAMKADDRTPSDEEIEAMLIDPKWAMLHKYDGNGSIVVPAGTTIQPGVDATGKQVASYVTPVPMVLNLGHQPATWGGEVAEYLKRVLGAIDWQYALHGEWLNNPATGKVEGGKLVVWTDQGPGTWLERYARLEMLFSPYLAPGLFELAPYETDELRKRALRHDLFANHAEGAIFSHLDGLYEFGTRSKQTIKDKFTSDADVLIYEVLIKTDKPGLFSGSAFFAVLDEHGKLIPFGKVGIADSKNVDLFTRWKKWADAGGTPIGKVRYLYATPDHLYQTTLLDIREDKKGLPLHLAVSHKKDLRLGGKFKGRQNIPAAPKAAQPSLL